MKNKKEKIEEVVKDIIQEYKPEKMYLFGSFAWGKPNKDSDIDIFIIKDTKKNRLERQLEVRRIVKGRLPVDILVYTPKEVKERLKIKDFFIQDIINKGKPLYV